MGSFKRIRLSSIRLVNFKSYDDYTVDFVENSSIQRIIGLFGPNGTGKSTLLDAIGMLFKNYCGSDMQRMTASLKKYVRNVKNEGVVEVDDDFNIDTSGGKFRIEGNFVVEDGTSYRVVIGNDPGLYRWSNQKQDEHGKWIITCPPGTSEDGEHVVITGLVSDHPPVIKSTLVNQCYVTSYDKELNQFQLRKDRWDVFKMLFEAVTGFEVDKVDGELDERTISSPGQRAAMAHLDQYILGIRISKPHETISERQCSDGEKKIIKNFTTLLNKDCVPSVILIDNVEMHVEIDRHMILLDCIGRCFPDSQIVFTTHSEKIISEYDLSRLISLVNKNISRDQMWRQDILRILKGLKLSFRDESSQRSCGSLFVDMINENYDDIDDAKRRLSAIVANGSNRLLGSIGEIKK